MRILYLADVRMPTEKAHGLQIMKTCEALARLGHEVELVVPRRANDMKAIDPFVYYAVEKNFRITRLATFDPPIGEVRFSLQRVIFSLRVLMYVLMHKSDVIYSRDESVLNLISRMRSNVVWESHIGSWNLSARAVAARARRIIAISQGLADYYVAKGIAKHKVAVAPDGIDLAQFEQHESQSEARTRLGIPSDARVAMYIGRVDGWKGIDTLGQASGLMRGVTTVVIGGEAEQVATLKKQYPTIVWLGSRPYSELPSNQQAADVLVLPNTGTSEISARFTSPLKLFTYMASGKPIVASDLPSIREVLDERSAYLVAPDDPLALASQIQVALNEGDARALEAKRRVVAYSWDARARIIANACL